MLTLNDGRKELYQWDTGRTATVDIECDVVHFANLKYGESLAVEVKVGKVAIPNKLLMSGEPIYCWAFVKDENGAYTKKEQILAVTKRAKPSDYVYEETEIITIKTAVENALQEAKESGDFKGEKGETGATGPAGKDGANGKDGTSVTVSSVSESTEDGGNNVVTFSDGKTLTVKNGSKGSQGEKGDPGEVTLEYANNTFSNALKGTKSDTAIFLDDISPVTHEMSVKISSDTVTDLTAVKVSRCGKNLIPFPYQDLKLGTSRYNGVDFTVYEDGSILINGTATISTTKYLYRNATDLLGLKSGITISGSKNASDNTQQANVYFICNYYDSTGKMQIGIQASTVASGTKTISDHWKGLGIYINIPNGKTLNNLLIKPQLEIGTTSTEYEPYITPIEYTPSADGTVNGVTSLYPNTTLTTDMDGVLIDCEYNRDINKAFAELQQAILSLGGTI